MPDPDRRVGTAEEHLRQVVETAIATLERHPDFLRLLLVYAIQRPSDAADVDAVVGRVRELALGRLRKADLDRPRRRPRDAQTDQLARFALAAFDGASSPGRPTRSEAGPAAHAASRRPRRRAQRA